MKPRTKSCLFLMLILLSGCATKSPDLSFCGNAHPIYFDKDDKVSIETEREVYSHFKKGQDLCGWDKA